MPNIRVHFRPNVAVSVGARVDLTLTVESPLITTDETTLRVYDDTGERRTFVACFPLDAIDGVVLESAGDYTGR